MFKLLGHIGKVLLTGAIITCEKIGQVCSDVGDSITQLKTWAMQKFSLPKEKNNGVLAYVRTLCVRQLLMIVGGFVCCFLFEEAHGDLTWFERMFTSARDYVGNIALSCVESGKNKVFSWFYKEPEIQGG